MEQDGALHGGGQLWPGHSCEFHTRAPHVNVTHESRTCEAAVATGRQAPANVSSPPWT